MERASSLAVLTPFVFYPFSKTLWLAFDLYFQPEPPEAMARPGNHRDRST